MAPSLPREESLGMPHQGRELAEELSPRITVCDDSYLGSMYLPGPNICTHMFEKKVTAAELDQLEEDALRAHDRFEVCGTLRCPCYALPNNKGFATFLQQKFAGNARQQLLQLVRERGLVESAVIEQAVALAVGG